MSRASSSGPVQPASFRESFNTALMGSGYTLKRLSDRLLERGLPVSVSALSRWRSGERRPDGIRSLRLLTVIEQELGVLPGVLTGTLIGRSRRLGSITPDTGLDVAPTVLALWDSLQVAPRSDVRALSIQEDIEIDSSGSVRAVSSVGIFQGMRDTVRSIGIIMDANPQSSEPPEVTLRTGGTVADSRMASDGTALGISVELDTALTVGATGLLSWNTLYPADQPSPLHYACQMSHPVREVLVVLHFAGPHPPTWIDEVLNTRDDLHRRTHPGNTSSFHTIHSGIGPGQLQLSWGWD